MAKTCAGIVFFLMSLLFVSESNARMSAVESDGREGHRMQSIHEVDRGNCCDEARWWVTAPTLRAARSSRSVGLAGYGCLELRDAHGRTVLHHAALHGSQKRVQLLLAAGADADAKDDGGYTALDLAKSHGFWNVAKVLIAATSDIEGTGGSQETLTQRIAAERRSGAIRALGAAEGPSKG